MGADEIYTLKQAQDDFAAPAIGRPKLMTPEVLYERFEEYRLSVKGDPCLVQDYVGKDGKEVDRKKEKPLIMDGFENYLEEIYGIGAIQQYLENRFDAYKEYIPVVQRIKRIIRVDQITGGFTGIYKENITARINGINDTIDTKGDNVKLINFDEL